MGATVTRCSKWIASLAGVGVVLGLHIPSVAAAQAPATGCPEASVQEASIVGELARRQIEPGPAFDILKLPAPMLAQLQEVGKTQARHQARDWANVCRFKAANAALLRGGQRPRIVLMGDSITENWRRADPALFTSAVADRGIGGQTSAQMLLRFQTDVVALRPRIVHILAGTNDLGSTLGDEYYLNNIKAMLDLAKANNIAVILGSIPPSHRTMFGDDPTRIPRIAQLNAALARMAADRKAVFVDYHAILADPSGRMREGLSNDDVHPTRAGYALMRPLLERAIARADR